MRGRATMRDKKISLAIIIWMYTTFALGNSIVSTMENAIHHSHKLKAQGIALEIYQKHEEKAYANNKPKIDVSIYQSSQKTEFIERPSSINNSTNYTFSIKQNLYNGYYDVHAIEMANTDVAIHSLEYNRVEQIIMYEAVMAHLSVVLSKKILLIQKQLLSEYKALLSIASQKAFYGDANEKMELELRHHQAKLKYLGLQETFELKKFKYKQLTGLKARKLKEDIKIHSSLVTSPQRVDLREANPMLLKNILEIEKAHSQIKRDESKFLPKIDIEIKAYKAEPLAQLSYATQNQYSATLSLNYNLYNGHRDKLDHEINQLQKLKFMLEGEDLNKDILLQYSDFYTKYTYSYKSARTIKRYLYAEKKKYQQYKKIFKLSNAKSLLDLLTSLTNLYYAKELKVTNQHTKMMNYTNLLLLQSKLILDNFR